MNREDLMKAMQFTASLLPEPVEVPGWGTLYVKQMTVAEVTANINDAKIGKDDQQALVRGAARVICDESGKLLFDAANADDIALLAKQPWVLLSKIITAANRINGLSEEAQAEAGNG